MEALIASYYESFPTIVLLLIIAATLYTLGKGADLLVEEAVSLSVRWGVPKMIIGATIVSLGTTVPETTVSVMAALQGNPDLALGNAIGSIIVDTGLILGIAAILGRVPIDQGTINRQGRMQIGAALLLSVVSLPFLSRTGNGNISQLVGFLFLILLVAYIVMSIRWAKGTHVTPTELQVENKPVILILLKLFAGIAIIIVSSKLLIPSVEITAIRVGIPQSIIAATLYTLGKGADLLVEEAVSLSVRWGVPKMIIGATIVSLGTTVPETTVSVMAALQGNPDLALGNAIGSIIVDTGLILGIAAILGRVPIDQGTINRQGRMQIGAALLLSVVSLPFLSRTGNGNISQLVGFIFLILLVGYIVMSIRWAKGTHVTPTELHVENKPVILILLKLFAGIAIIIVSSKLLIPSVEITAIRVGIPQSIIAATLVAFGTSLPELMTAIASVRKGHGELAVGNIIGADILNVLFVTGSAAAVTVGGLDVPVDFYKLQIPAMLVILTTFRIFAKSKENLISRKEGLVLVTMYGVYLVLNYTLI